MGIRVTNVHKIYYFCSCKCEICFPFLQPRGFYARIFDHFWSEIE